MTLLLCILLYLSVIFSPNEYTITQIEGYEQANQTQVDEIENDSELSQQVYDAYYTQSQWITIIDPGVQ